MKIGINQKIIALLLCNLTLQPANNIAQPRSLLMQSRLAIAIELGFATAVGTCAGLTNHYYLQRHNPLLRETLHNAISRSVRTVENYITIGKTAFIKALNRASTSARPWLDGTSPLRVAAGRGYTSIVQLLTGTCGIEDHENKALIRAAQNRHQNAVLALLKRSSGILEQTSLYCTTRNAAAHDRHAHVAWMLTDNSARNLKSETLLNALRTDDTNTARILLAVGTDTRTQDSDGKRPLHLAAMRGDVTMVQELLDHGASVDDQDANGKTALHLAAFNNRVEVVRKLLEHGANVNAKASGFTALQLASNNGHTEITQVLLAHMIADTRSEHQKLLHNNCNIAKLHELLQAQGGEDPISREPISIYNMSSFVVLPTSPTTVITVKSALDLLNQFRGQDPFNKLPIPEWFIDLLLEARE